MQSQSKQRRGKRSLLPCCSLQFQETFRTKGEDFKAEAKTAAFKSSHTSSIMEEASKQPVAVAHGDLSNANFPRDGEGRVYHLSVKRGEGAFVFTCSPR